MAPENTNKNRRLRKNYSTPLFQLETTEYTKSPDSLFLTRCVDMEACSASQTSLIGFEECGHFFNNFPRNVSGWEYFICHPCTIFGTSGTHTRAPEKRIKDHIMSNFLQLGATRQEVGSTFPFSPRNPVVISIQERLVEAIYLDSE